MAPKISLSYTCVVDIAVYLKPTPLSIIPISLCQQTATKLFYIFSGLFLLFLSFFSSLVFATTADVANPRSFVCPISRFRKSPESQTTMPVIFVLVAVVIFLLESSSSPLSKSSELVTLLDYCLVEMSIINSYPVLRASPSSSRMYLAINYISR